MIHKSSFLDDKQQEVEVRLPHGKSTFQYKRDKITKAFLTCLFLAITTAHKQQRQFNDYNDSPRDNQSVYAFIMIFIIAARRQSSRLKN